MGWRGVVLLCHGWGVVEATCTCTQLDATSQVGGGGVSSTSLPLANTLDAMFSIGWGWRGVLLTLLAFANICDATS